jgi:hypothetical protein
MLEVGTGMRLMAPMVLGASIAFVDTVAVVNEVSLRLLCLTGEGQVFVWQMDGFSDKGDRNNRHFSLNKVLKTEIKPLLLSLRLRDRPSSSTASSQATVSVERCYLHSTSHSPIISLSSVGALGGDFQTFQFNTSADCWQRIADSRHFLSR